MNPVFFVLGRALLWYAGIPRKERPAQRHAAAGGGPDGAVRQRVDHSGSGPEPDKVGKPDPDLLNKLRIRIRVIQFHDIKFLNYQQILCFNDHILNKYILKKELFR